jgi:hypothetical protein
MASSWVVELKWLIEFGTPIELKISVRDDQEIHYQIFHQCVELCRGLQVPARRFALGSSGEGGGLLSIFRREWGPVVGIEEAGRVSDRPVSAVNPRLASEECDRVVSELHFAVREFAVNDALRNMPLEAIKEFCARRWEMRNKKVRVETKTEMRKHFVRSPDYADSCCFAVELARRLGADARSFWIIASYGDDKAIQVIMDNLNTHKPANDRWLKRHRNLHFHFTPTHAS